MSKKIIISESQYRRVFLSEQKVTPRWNPHISMWTHPAYSDYPDVPKDMIYKKNPDGTFSKKYSTISNRFNVSVGDDVSIDDPDVIKKRIELKNENEFKNFIKTKEDGDKFRRWVRDDSERLSKVEKELKKNNLPGTLDASGDYDNDYIKIAWNLFSQEFIMSGYRNDGVSYLDNLKSEQIQNTEHYKTYKNAISNWNSVNGFFKWTSPKTISSEYIGKISSGEVDVSTCIDPTYILKEQNKLFNNMFKIDPGKTSKFIEERGFGSHWEEVGLGVTADSPMMFWDIKDGKIVDAEVSDDERRWYDNVILYNKYDHFLNNVIYPHNTIISLQNKNRYNNACEDVYYKTTYKKEWHGNVQSNVPVKHYFKWIDVCKPYGGTFMRSTKPIKEEPGIKSVGFTENSVVCGCVKINDKIKIYGKPITDWVEVGDIRSGWRKFEEGLGDCATDWHCIADIASIAVLALGPVGVLLSGAIDLVNTIGYVVEQDEGWKLNAGLTFLGVLPGFGEAKFLASKGTKFASKLEDLGKILDVNKGGDIFKLEKSIADWSKSLTEKELKYYDEFVNLTKKVGQNKSLVDDWMKTIDIINKQTKNLNKIDQGVLAKMFKKESHETIQKLLKEANGDVATMIKKYYGGGKQVLIQSGLFVSVHVFAEEIGSWVGEEYKALYEKTGLDPFGVMNTKLTKGEQKKIQVDFTDLIEKRRMDSIPDYVNSKKDLNTVLDINYKVYEIYNKLIKNTIIKEKVEKIYSSYQKIVNNGLIVEAEDFITLKDLWVKLSKQKPTDKSFTEVYDKLMISINSFESNTPISNLDKIAIVVTEDTSYTYSKLEQKLNEITDPKDIENLEFDDLIKNEGFLINKIIINKYPINYMQNIINKWTL